MINQDFNSFPVVSDSKLSAKVLSNWITGVKCSKFEFDWTLRNDSRWRSLDEKSSSSPTVCIVVVFESRKVLSHGMVYYSRARFPFFASTKLNRIFYDIVMTWKAERERKRLSCLEIMKMMDRRCSALNPFDWMDDVAMTRATNFFRRIKLIFAIKGMQGAWLLACVTVEQANGYNGDRWRGWGGGERNPAPNASRGQKFQKGFQQFLLKCNLLFHKIRNSKIIWSDERNEEQELC